MMRAASALRLAVVVTAITAGCSDRATSKGAEQAALGGTVAARVDDEIIPLALVAAVAEAQHVAPDIARARLVDDAVAARAARLRGLDREAPAAWNLRAARARFAVDRMLAAARAKGPPTDEEVRRISDLHWQEVDRPPSARTVHVVVLVDRRDPAEKKERARTLAEQLRAEVLAAKDADEFLVKAKAAPHPGDLKVQAEALPPVTADGWVSEGSGQMDPRFSRAANELASAGATSPVVESDFGFHVIRLVERVPERRMPLDARRVAFVDEAHSLRAQDEKQARLEALRAESPIVIAPGADELMRSLSATKERGH